MGKGGGGGLGCRFPNPFPVHLSEFNPCASEGWENDDVCNKKAVTPAYTRLFVSYLLKGKNASDFSKKPK